MDPGGFTLSAKGIDENEQLWGPFINLFYFFYNVIQWILPFGNNFMLVMFEFKSFNWPFVSLAMYIGNYQLIFKSNCFSERYSNRGGSRVKLKYKSMIMLMLFISLRPVNILKEICIFNDVKNLMLFI